MSSKAGGTSFAGRAACLVVAFAAVACQGEVVDYYPPSGAVGSGGSSSGTGGSGATVNELRRAGYGGGPTGWQGVVIAPGLSSLREEDHNACLPPDVVVRWEIDMSGCTAASLCSPGCTKDTDCPAGGTAVPRCVACTDAANSSESACFPDLPACVLECTEDSQCPSDMACRVDEVGFRVCMFPDVPFTPGCEGYCARSGYGCDDETPCCDGLVCSEDGTCAASPSSPAP
jgi:hypothetical protein